MSIREMKTEVIVFDASEAGVVFGFLYSGPIVSPDNPVSFENGKKRFSGYPTTAFTECAFGLHQYQ